MVAKKLIKELKAYLTDEWVILNDEVEKKEINKIEESNILNIKKDDEKTLMLKEIEKKCKECKKCSLYKTAKNLVFSDGNANSELVLIGEAPGAEEDEQGIPFVGKAGRLMNSVIEELGYHRSQFYIANVLKHRPPDNRPPSIDEIQACSPFLLEQLKIINPKLIITLGNFSLKLLSNNQNIKITSERGKFFKSIFGYYVLPTYHPAAILRNMNLLTDFKNDLLKGFEFLKK